MAKDTIIDRELADAQKQKWGLRKRRRRDAAADDGFDIAAEQSELPEQPPIEDAVEPDSPPSVGPSKFKEFIGGMLSGSILSRAEVRRQYPYMLFLAVLMLLYIANTFRMHQLYRQRQALVIEVKELRSKSVTLSANLAQITRQSAILEELNRRGIVLEESVVPPKVIRR